MCIRPWFFCASWLQANQTGSSNAMELEGGKLCFDYLQGVAGLTVKVFVSNRHRGIAKWIRECHPTVTHFFDQWHVAKGLVKKLLAASKQKGCEVIAQWVKAVKNHIFWCSTSTKPRFNFGQVEIFHSACVKQTYQSPWQAFWRMCAWWWHYA